MISEPASRGFPSAMTIAAMRYHRTVSRVPRPHRRPRSHIADRKFYPSVFVAPLLPVVPPLSSSSSSSSSSITLRLFSTNRRYPPTWLGWRGLTTAKLLKSGIPFNGSRQRLNIFMDNSHAEMLHRRCVTSAKCFKKRRALSELLYNSAGDVTI